MQNTNVAVPVKLWALLCTIIGISLTNNPTYMFVLVILGFVYLAVQRKFRLIISFGIFYMVLAMILYLIRYHDLKMIVFSEFYVLLFWSLSAVFIVGWDLITTPPGDLAAFLSQLHTPTAVILGILVIFRFAPTMRSELKSIGQSMRNRGLTAPLQVISHPLVTCEYVLVPMLLRCLQVADQLSVSAVARGAERPGKRGSYYGKKIGITDIIWIVLWTIITITFLGIGGIRI